MQMSIVALKLKTIHPWKESYDQQESILKSRDNTLPTKVNLVKIMVFCPSIHVRVELLRKLSTKELSLWDCSTGKDF